MYTFVQFTYSHSFIHSLIHSFIHSFFQSVNQSVSQSFIHLVIYSFIDLQYFYAYKNDLPDAEGWGGDKLDMELLEWNYELQDISRTRTTAQDLGGFCGAQQIWCCWD